MITTVYRYLAWAAVAMALLGVVALKAYIFGVDHQRDADLGASAKLQQKVDADFQWNVQNGQRLGALLLAANHESLGRYNQIQARKANDTHPTVAPTPGAAPAVPVLTASAVGLFNCGWDGQVPGGQPGSGAVAGSLCPAADEQGPSPFDVRDALYSDGINAQICWADIRQLRSLIQYERDRVAHAAGHP